MKGKKIQYDFNSLRRNVMAALCLTKLSGTDFRIIIHILNQTDAYQRSEDKIKPAFFEERTGLDKSNVRRTIARLRSWQMIAKQGHIYTVLSPDKWDKVVFIEQKRINIEAVLELEPDPAPPGCGEVNNKLITKEQPDQKRVKSEAKTASNLKRSEVKSEAVLASLYREPSIENSIENNNAAFLAKSGVISRKLKRVISYYFKAYQDHTGKPHPNLKPEQWQKVARVLESFADEKVVSDLEDWKILIDYHFQRELKTDWNINHFATPGILENLHFKNLY